MGSCRQFSKRLEATGIDRGAVTDVVITLMHMDHIGVVLVDELKSRLLPNERIHVLATEIVF